LNPVIHTFTGKEVNPLNVHLDDICIEDIAHALACTNRFCGHTRVPISVAQHSVYVSRFVQSEGQLHHQRAPLQGLLHDAAEAYLGDVTKWLKHSKPMKTFREAEDRLQCVIYEKFGLPWTMFLEVEWADRVMVRFEGMKGFGKSFKINHPNYPPLTKAEIEAVGKWSPWSWKQSEEAFLAQYRTLTPPFSTFGTDAGTARIRGGKASSSGADAGGKG
jgi:hypothetical protein